ncbi:hypothetical protein BDP27DRAFT_1372065 [Rhodocollybia butyracea]|uniref:Uncharacterized protein n=1 Tax=Rhodocollybia butyracea TaxID=206335 RepID=A0A9P5P7U2_9AGAR|nr:hypothetical protein BDP27DRAFT_1372065 [Rhodocollybia butyracea]
MSALPKKGKASNHNVARSAYPSTAGSNRRGAVPLNLRIVFIPEPCDTDLVPDPTLEWRPLASGIRIRIPNVHLLVEALEAQGLVWTVLVPAGSTGMETRDTVDHSITSQLAAMEITLPPRLPTSQTTLLWVVAQSNIKPSKIKGSEKRHPRAYPLLRQAFATDWWEAPTLLPYLDKTKSEHGFEERTIFITPASGPINWQRHFCAGFKLVTPFLHDPKWAELPQEDEDSDTEKDTDNFTCFRECPVVPSHPLHYPIPRVNGSTTAPSTMDVESLSSRQSAIPVLGASDLPLSSGFLLPSTSVSFTQPGALDIDDGDSEEAENIQRAIDLSLMDQAQASAQQHSSSEAGPSTAPGNAPPIPPRNTRPVRSVSPLPNPRPQARRRLDLLDNIMSDCRPTNNPTTTAELRSLLLPLTPGHTISVVSDLPSADVAAASFIKELISFHGYPLASNRAVQVDLPVGLQYFGCKIKVKLIIWTDIASGLKSLALDKMASAKMTATVKAYGTLTGLILIHLRYLPDFITPSFFVACTGQSCDVDDVTFLSQFHSSASSAAEIWPTEATGWVLPDNETVKQLIEVYLVQEHATFYQDYNSLPTEDRAQIRYQIITRVALGLPIGVTTFEDHPLVTAFQHGFDIRLGSSYSLLKIFGSHSKSLFPLLTSCLAEDGAALEAANCIKWVLPTAASDEEHDLAAKWQRLFFRWVRGKGHIQHPEFDCLISEDERVAVAEDMAFRVRKFLLFATGVEAIAWGLDLTYLPVRWIKWLPCIME